tara:strand:- start:38677 stop:39318 length:642 start_codon:yes stop_codon:yes gene_type:complete
LKTALIQPQFAPNLFDLGSMLIADRVILLDTDTWSRKGRTHRAMIPADRGTQWINIPIKTADKKKPIREVRIDHSQDWFTPFWNAILHTYSDYLYFDHFHDELLALLGSHSDQSRLIDFNMAVFNKLLTYLEVSFDFELKSESDQPTVTEDKIIQEYQSKNYIYQLESSLSYNEKILNVCTQHQTNPEFSIIDLLMSKGPESYRILDQIRLTA